MRETCENCTHGIKSVSLFCNTNRTPVTSNSYCAEWKLPDKPPMQEQIEQIADAYEFTHQSIKLFEEMGELQQALAKTLLDTGPISEYEFSLANLKEELADVQIMLLQIIYLLDISEDELREMMEGKIGRQLKRMEEGDSDG